MPIEPNELDRIVGDDPLSPKQVGELPPTCPTCGYILTVLTSTICPECGNPFSRRTLRSQASAMRLRFETLKGLNEWIRFGFGVGCFGMGVALLGLLFGSAFGGLVIILARFVAIPCGCVALGMGLSVVQAYRVPATVRRNAEWTVNYPLALLDMLLGVGQILLCLL